MNKQHFHQQRGYAIYLLTKMLFLASITLSLIGCSNTYPTHPLITQEYSNSKYFDRTLSENMKKGSSKIEITISTPFSRNNIPDRLDAWLTVIENSGGKVTEEPAEGERDLAMILTIQIPACTPYNNKRILVLYFPARNYNAKLLYRKDESGDAMINKIVFTRR